MAQTSHVPSVIIHKLENGTKDTFTCYEELGHGGFATVYRVKHHGTNKTYAMKIISKERFISSKGKASLEKLKNEIQIQKSLNHINIVQSKLSFSDEFNYYIALEYCPGKTIREYLRSSGKSYLSETETRKILRDIINGLIYLHNRRIIHHDLKLENFIIGSDGKVKIADFGLATYAKDQEQKKNSSICGTPNYMSPESLLKTDKGTGFESDIWAIGIAAYIMLTGKAPFAGIAKEAIYENIKNCVFNFPSQILLSSEARDFITSILKFDPLKRPTAINLLNHPFMKKFDTEQIQLYKPENEFIQKVRPNSSFQSIQKLRSSAPAPSSKNADSPLLKFTGIQNIDYKKRFLSSMINDDTKAGRISTQNQYLHGSSLVRTSNINSSRYSSRISDENDSSFKRSSNIENKDINNNLSNSNLKKTFTIPSNFVVKHCFMKDDLCYLLGNGTVGICFSDKSKIVLEPNEEFVQIYKNNNSLDEVIDLNNSLDISTKLQDQISLVKKFARAFKKIKSFYENNRNNYISSIPLHHVSDFIKKDDSVLFKMNNNNVQVNFNDGNKLFIFSNTRKMCMSKNIKDKSILFDQTDVLRMNSNTEELIKYKKAKELLYVLDRKIRNF